VAEGIYHLPQITLDCFPWLQIIVALSIVTMLVGGVFITGKVMLTTGKLDGLALLLGQRQPEHSVSR